MATVANGMGNVAASWFLALAIRRGTDIQQAVGNLQNDPLKEFTGRGTFIYPVAGHMKFTLDTVEYCISNLPHWRPISVCGSQLRWGGGTAVEEVGFAIAHTEAYLDGLIARGLDLVKFSLCSNSTWWPTARSSRRRRSSAPFGGVGPNGW